MLKKKKFPTLGNRRKMSSLIMFFKIKTGQVRIPLQSYITPPLRNRYTITYSRVYVHLHSLFPRTVRLWYNIPPDLTCRPYLETFRAGLAKHFQKKPKHPSPSLSSPLAYIVITIININIITRYHYHHHHQLKKFGVCLKYLVFILGGVLDQVFWEYRAIMLGQSLCIHKGGGGCGRAYVCTKVQSTRPVVTTHCTLRL